MKKNKILISLLFPFSFVANAQLSSKESYDSFLQLNVGVSQIEGAKNNSGEFQPVLGFDYQLYDKKTKAGINLIGDHSIHGFLTYDMFSYGSYGMKFKSSLEYGFNNADDQNDDISLTPSLGLTAYYNINNLLKINIGYDYGVGSDRIASAFLTYRFGLDDYYSFSVSKRTNEKIIYLKKKPVEKVVLRDTATQLFAFDSYDLTDEGKLEISEFTKRIDLNRLKMIYISGHTDQQGSAKYNWELSRKRARTVYKKILSDTGVEEDKVNYYGLGETTPISDVMDENRRVEILVQYE